MGFIPHISPPVQSKWVRTVDEHDSLRNDKVPSRICLYLKCNQKVACLGFPEEKMAV